MGESRKSLAKIVIERTDDKTTYMVFFEDLFELDGEYANFHDTGRKRPKSCKTCSSKEIAELEEIGAGNKPLFWVCLECDSLYMKYTIKTTLSKLRKVTETWTNPNDWGWKDKDEFN